MSVQDIAVRTSTVSYGSRLGTSGLDFVGGILVVAGSCAFLWWNERRARNQTRAIRQVAQEVKEVKELNIKNDGKVIHYVGDMRGNGTSDPDFKISINDSSSSSSSSRSPADFPPATNPELDRDESHDFLYLRRTVEMYQWHEIKEVERKDKLGGSQEVITTFKYKTDWSSTPQDSSRFEVQRDHQNPPVYIESKTFLPNATQIGPFRVNPNVITPSLSHLVSDLSPQEIKFEGKRISGSNSGYVYLRGSDRAIPQVGDIRVKFQFIPSPQKVTIIGKQVGEGITQWTTEDGDAALGPLLQSGIHSAQSLLASTEADQGSITHLFRLLGYIGNFVGFRLLLSPLITGTVIIPLFADLLGVGANIVSAACSLSVSSLTILCGWLEARAPFDVLKYPIRLGWLIVCYLTLAGIYRTSKWSIEGGFSFVRGLVKTIWTFFQVKQTIAPAV